MTEEQRAELEALRAEKETYDALQRQNALFTLSGGQKLVIAAVVIVWGLLLVSYGDVNFAQPLVKLDQQIVSLLK